MILSAIKGSASSESPEAESLEELWPYGWPQTVAEFEKLVEVFQHRLVRYAFRRLGDRRDAEDKRYVVLFQTKMFNTAAQSMIKDGTLVYTSPNGFKVWSTRMDQMGANIALQSARPVLKDTPAEDRTGRLFEAPDGTIVAFAINGPITDEELHQLVDSLVPVTDLVGR